MAWRRGMVVSVVLLQLLLPLWGSSVSLLATLWLVATWRCVCLRASWRVSLERLPADGGELLELSEECQA